MSIETYIYLRECSHSIGAGGVVVLRGFEPQP